MLNKNFLNCIVKITLPSQKRTDCPVSVRSSIDIDCIVLYNRFLWSKFEKKQFDELVQVLTRYCFSDVVLNQ